MSYRFIFLTWLLIIPINIVAISFALAISAWADTGFVAPSTHLIDPEAMFIFGMLSIPFATPGLFGLMILCWMAEEFIHDLKSRYVFIVTGCSILTVLCYVLLELVLDLNASINEYLLLVSASLLSVWLALAMTRSIYYNFYKSHFPSDHFKIKSFETDIP